MMMSIDLMPMERKSYIKKRINTKEESDEKQKEVNGLHRPGQKPNFVGKKSSI